MLAHLFLQALDNMSRFGKGEIDIVHDSSVPCPLARPVLEQEGNQWRTKGATMSSCKAMKKSVMRRGKSKKTRCWKQISVVQI